MRAIDSGGGAIFFTDGVNVRRITQRIDISRAYVRAECRGGRAPLCQRIIDNRLWRPKQQPFGQRRRLRQ